MNKQINQGIMGISSNLMNADCITVYDPSRGNPAGAAAALLPF